MCFYYNFGLYFKFFYRHAGVLTWLQAHSLQITRDNFCIHLGIIYQSLTLGCPSRTCGLYFSQMWWKEFHKIRTVDRNQLLLGTFLDINFHSCHRNAISICERSSNAVFSLGQRGQVGRCWEDSGAFTNLDVSVPMIMIFWKFTQDFAEFCQENLRKKTHIILRPGRHTHMVLARLSIWSTLGSWIETKHPNPHESSQRTGEHTASSRERQEKYVI